MPAPDTLVEAAGNADPMRAVVGSPGDGCYVYLCVEVGGHVPVGSLPRVEVRPGTPLSARLSDGSGIVAWQATLAPRHGAAAEPISGQSAANDPAATSLDLAGLAAPSDGNWILTLKIELDRERGWMTTSYLVVAE